MDSPGSPKSERKNHRVAILGGGFGGLHAARILSRSAVEVTLIDRRNFHLFQPLLYQVATGGLSPADIAAPLRALFRRSRNVRIVLGEAVDIDAQRRLVVLRDGEIEYDSLIVATGARHHYFGNDGWESLAPGLKSVEDATEIRARIFGAFEEAEKEPDPKKRAAWLTFAIVGGGPTGVELAGTIGELARGTLRGNFRSFDPAEARIILVEASAERILLSFPPALSRRAAELLGELGVEVRTGALVTRIEEGRIHLRCGAGDAAREETIESRTVIWAAGISASPLGECLKRTAGVALDRMGRVIVEPDLSIPGHPEVFVIGDLANFAHQGGAPLPGVAPVAMQEGRHAAAAILRRLEGDTRPLRFRYRNRGNLATIGRSRAVADLGKLRFGGFFAWILWLFIHLLYLVDFENRILVLTQWAWNYWTRNRSARLITGAPREKR